MITSWPTKNRLNLVGFWSFFYRLSFDRKNRSVKPQKKVTPYRFKYGKRFRTPSGLCGRCKTDRLHPNNRLLFS